MAQNRTINFYGYAYGNTPVSLTANINGTTVFSGAVSTIDQELPAPNDNISNAPVLFSVTDSALFPTDFAGAYPMTIEVDGGYGIAVQNTYCNYMENFNVKVEAGNSTISGTTLTLGNVIDGDISNVLLNCGVNGTGVMANTYVTAVSTDGVTLQVSPSQTVNSTTISVRGFPKYGDATTFVDCYAGTPSNSEGTPDSRSSVEIDGVPQVPPNPVSLGQWTWVVPTGSTLFCAFNVALGNATP